MTYIYIAIVALAIFFIIDEERQRRKPRPLQTQTPDQNSSIKPTTQTGWRPESIMIISAIVFILCFIGCYKQRSHLTPFSVHVNYPNLSGGYNRRPPGGRIHDRPYTGAMAIYTIGALLSLGTFTLFGLAMANDKSMEKYKLKQKQKDNDKGST